MSAFGGAQGYENLSSAQQKERSAADAFDHGLAQTPSAPPDRLSRILYIPTHASSEASLTIYDASAEYKHAINHSPLGGSEIVGVPAMGSRLFATRLSSIKKPSADKARYILQARNEEDAISATLKAKGEDKQAIVGTISLRPTTQDFSLEMEKDTINIVTSFPIQDTAASVGTARHPYFTFSLPDGRAMQWQIHPLQSGPLRYDLVERDQRDSEECLPSSENIIAVYHGIGQASSLSTPGSHGVLLLPGSDDLRTEATIVASLMGFLWRVRSLEVVPHDDNLAQREKRSILWRIFGKA